MEIWIEVIKFAGAFIIALVTTQFTLKRSIGETLAVLKDRLDVLWDIYVKDAIREARKMQLVQENSPLSVTSEWERLVPEDLRKSIIEFIERKRGGASSLILRAVSREFLEDLYLVSVEKDVSIPALLGTLQVYIEGKK